MRSFKSNIYPIEIVDATLCVGLTWVYRHLLTASVEKLGSRSLFVRIEANATNHISTHKICKNFMYTERNEKIHAFWVGC